MKAKIYITLIINCLTISCSSIKKFTEKNDLEKENLKGKVKTVKYFKDSILKRVIKYNEDGFKTKMTFLNDNGKAQSETLYNYTNGFLSSRIEKLHGEKKSETVFKRDHKNRVKTAIFQSNSGNNSKTTYEYNSKNQVIKLVDKREKGGSDCYTFEYGNNYVKKTHCKRGIENYHELSNEMIIKYLTYVNGKISYNYKFEYNKNKDRISATTFWKKEKKEKTKTEYIYDNKNNWITKTILYVLGVVEGSSEINRTIEYYKD